VYLPATASAEAGGQVGELQRECHVFSFG